MRPQVHTSLVIAREVPGAGARCYTAGHAKTEDTPMGTATAASRIASRRAALHSAGVARNSAHVRVTAGPGARLCWPVQQRAALTRRRRSARVSALPWSREDAPPLPYLITTALPSPGWSLALFLPALPHHLPQRSTAARLGHRTVTATSVRINHPPLHTPRASHSCTTPQPLAPRPHTQRTPHASATPQPRHLPR